MRLIVKIICILGLMCWVKCKQVKNTAKKDLISLKFFIPVLKYKNKVILIKKSFKEIFV